MWTSLLIVLVCAAYSTGDKIERPNATLPRSAEDAAIYLENCFHALPKKLDAQFTVQQCPVFGDSRKLLIYGLHTAVRLIRVQCSANGPQQFDCEGEISFEWVRFLLDNPGLRGEVILANKNPPVKFSVGRKTSESIPWDDLPNIASIVMYEGSLDKKWTNLIDNCVKTRLDLVKKVVDDLLKFGPPP